MSNQRRQLFLINTLFDLQRLGRSSHKSFSAVHLYRHRYYIYIYIMHVQIHTKQTISSLWLQTHSHSQTWGPLRPSDFLHAADKQEVTAELQHRSHPVARKMLKRLCTSVASQGALLFPPADSQFSPFTCDLPPTGCCHISMSPLLFPTSVATSCSPLTKKKKRGGASHTNAKSFQIWRPSACTSFGATNTPIFCAQNEHGAIPAAILEIHLVMDGAVVRVKHE